MCCCATKVGECERDGGSQPNARLLRVRSVEGNARRQRLIKRAMTSDTIRARARVFARDQKAIRAHCSAVLSCESEYICPPHPPSLPFPFSSSLSRLFFRRVQIKLRLASCRTFNCYTNVPPCPSSCTSLVHTHPASTLHLLRSTYYQ